MNYSIQLSKDFKALKVWMTIKTFGYSKIQRSINNDIDMARYAYEIVKKVQEKKIQVIPWTVNSNDDIAKILELGVDGIISDYPDRVKYLLNEKI